MGKTFLVAALLAACLSGCQSPEANKAAGMTVLNIDDLNDQHKKDKEGLRAKYDGKEVVIIGTASQDFDPNNAYFEMGKPWRFHMRGDLNKETWVGVDCMAEAADKEKFTGIKKDATFAAKGVLHFNGGSMELSPCTRDFRGEK